MATIQNARDVLLQAAATRLETVAGPTNVTTDFANVTGSTRPSNNADVTQTAVNSGVTATSGGITLSSGGAIKGGQTAYDSGNGFFLGYTGSAYKFSVGNSSGNKLTWNGSTLGIVGDISGTSNIDITGSAKIKGNFTSGAYNVALAVNESYTAQTGLISYTTTSGQAAVQGAGMASGAGGVFGSSSGGLAISGVAQNSGGIGVQAVGVFGAVALSVNGAMTINNSTLVSNLNADMVDGLHASSLCQIVVGNTGTATVAGTGLNLTTTVSGVTVTCSSNNIVIEAVSDARLKRDIEDEALGLAFIQQLRPRTYRMRSNPALRYHGFIYQEVAELMRDDTPDALALHRPGSYGGVDYMSLVAPLVLAVQQLAARVQQLESA
jgi:hypothetical protein